MTLLVAVLLAALQGITEFLPVSSSGHLVLARSFLGVPQAGVGFEVVVHLGTLTAVLAVYGKDLLMLVRDCFRGDGKALRMLGFLAIASVPAGAAGVLLGDAVESAFGNPLLVSVMLLVTGTVLFLTRFAPRASRSCPSAGCSLLIGSAQACALLPGISRSGATVAAGLFRGLQQAEAARFSFLLAVPAITGAGILKLREIETSLDPIVSVTGLVVSAVVGYLALRLLLRFLRAGRFSSFSWYCWAVGAAGLTVSILKGF